MNTCIRGADYIIMIPATTQLFEWGGGVAKGLGSQGSGAKHHKLSFDIIALVNNISSMG